LLAAPQQSEGGSLVTCHIDTIPHTLDSMSKAKVPETGAGYLGETMVHRISRAMGVVDNVTEAKAGWPPEITLKLPDGSTKKGHLSDFREPNSAERKQIPPAKPVES
jgi:hypothetical protein